MSANPAPESLADVELDRIVARVLRWLVPLLLAMYVAAFLDQANVGFAQDTLQADRHLSDGAYAIGASVFFVGYAVLEVPSNVMLHRVGARWWMTRIMITWGLVSAVLMFVAGPLSGALFDRDGSFGLQGWQWMFLVEGLLAVLVGLVARRYLVDRPQQISQALRNGRVLYFSFGSEAAGYQS